MKLSAPTSLTFGIAVLLAILGLLGKLVPSLSFVSTYAFWLLLVGFIVLALGVMFKGK